MSNLKTLSWEQISLNLNADTAILEIFIDGSLAAEISDCDDSHLNNNEFVEDILYGMGYEIIS